MMVTGVDIVQISRIEKIISNKRDSFINKIFTEKEIEYINKNGNSPRTIAGLYASKEAISKALGTGIGKVAWQDMEIHHDDRGKPMVYISHNQESLLMEMGINKFDLSISHDGDYAIAFVIGYYNG